MREAFVIWSSSPATMGDLLFITIFIIGIVPIIIQFFDDTGDK